MQYTNYNNYAKITDEEWVEKLMYIPPIQPLHYYFFKVKCSEFLKYIAENILNADCVESILGEFYEFLSHNDWYVLRSYKKKGNATLSTYLSKCSLYYFLRIKKKNDKSNVCSIENREIIEQLNYLATNNEEKANTRLWQAFAKLNVRDRIILRRLIIEGRTTIEIAEEVWPYVKSNEKDWRKLPIKRVQDTIAMMKRRALFSLIEEMRMQYS
ncbi:MAG: sigma-70 family RNA polymerase sigma factor [Bacteroidales bacterium]|nr:sigma-70 family RNA polymerase sigma factor [Bacteroidales bacterium]MBR2607929.1 sigma-70 family RNA polymerase sigma factor [Bacteroidaceae bacterium]